MCNINYVKENISAYFPSLIQLIGQHNFNWDRVEKIFNKDYSKRLDKLEKMNAETMMVEAHLYDVIVAVKKGDSYYSRQLKFFDRILWDLNTILTEREKELIIPTIWNALTSLDRRHREFLAEMMVLKNCMSAGKYELDTIEFRLANGKRMDFRFKIKENGNYELVEVLSILLDADKVTDIDEEILKFLDHRLSDKIADKTIRLDTPVPFHLVPVLWGNGKALKVYSDYFKKQKMHLPHVQEPFAYTAFVKGDEKHAYMYKFGRISKLFDIPDETIVF